MISQLRRLALFKQGLVTSAQFGKNLSGTRRVIEHLGYVQIDTLAVVERAHHHILWNRVPSYKREHLNRLVNKRDIFEYWYHAASYLPMRDYRYALPQMDSIRKGENRYYTNVDKRLMKQILDRVKAEGPLRMRDIGKGNKAKKSNGNWWNWGPGRRALDKLFMQGDLMVCERNGMEKIYDLAEHCLPDGIDRSMPSLQEYANYLFDTTRRAHGVFTRKQLLHLKTGKPLRDAMDSILNEHIRDGVIERFSNEDIPDIYVDIEAFENIPTSDGMLKILSPFDNLVIHRDRLSSLFDFDYRLECYVPAPKRIYGYFCLPILYDGAFVGRIDCKAHRANQCLEIISLHLEKNAFDKEYFFPKLSDELQSFASFNECPLLEQQVIDQLRQCYSLAS